MVLGRTPFDLRCVVNAIASIFHPLADAKNFALTCGIAPDLTDGYGVDPIWLCNLF
ncbi:two-component system sensor histidine kinase/response regulator [Burkholderia metallica]|nr:two-component system sensor histidine kinase/response regulator [Burkholderia metallica]